MDTELTKLFGIMVPVLLAAIGLVVWIAKKASARSERITDKFIDHLTQTNVQQEAVNARHEEALQGVAEAIKINSRATDGVAETMKALTAEVGKWSCKAHQPPPRAKRKTQTT